MQKLVHYLIFTFLMIIILSCKKEEYIDSLGNVNEQISDTSDFQNAFVGTYYVYHHCVDTKYNIDTDFDELIWISKTSVKGILTLDHLTDGTGYGDDKVVEIAPNKQGRFRFSTYTGTDYDGYIDSSTGLIEYSYYIDDYVCSCSGSKYQ